MVAYVTAHKLKLIYPIFYDFLYFYYVLCHFCLRLHCTVTKIYDFSFKLCKHLFHYLIAFCIWMLLTVTPCIMLESCLKGKRCCKWNSCLCIKLLPGFNMFRCRFYNSSYRNSVLTTRNIFVECDNVCNSLIPQFINAVDGSIIYINPCFS